MAQPSRATAAEALEYVESVGYFLDPWQAYLTEQSLLESSESILPKWLCREYGYLAPRQNGKGGIITARSITDLFFLPNLNHYGDPEPRLVVYTAHQFKTAREAFIRLRDVIEGSPELRKQMRQSRNHGVNSAAGEEGFELANGNRLRYLARSTGGSGRGFTIHTMLVDEAQELPEPAWDALKFTQRAVRNPQRIVTGTVPDASNNGEVWSGMKQKGRNQDSLIAGWAEYSPDPNDEQTLYDMTKPAETGLDVDPNLTYALATNPAFGIRVTPETLQDDLEGKAESYKREVLCWWPDDKRTAKILSNWSSLHDPESKMLDPVVFAIEVAEDRSSSVIIAAGVRPGDGLPHIEVVEYAPGTDWVVDRLVQLQFSWYPQVVMYDVGGPAGSLTTDLKEAKVSIRPVTVREFGQACGMLYDATKQKALRWLFNQALDDSIKTARWRTLGQAKAWDRRIEGDASSVIAASLALFGVLTGATPEDDEKAKSISNAVYTFR